MKVSKAGIPFPNKKYQVIWADPPWQVRKIKRKSRPNQIEMDYPMMSLDEIKSLNVASLADENAVLFLWATQAYLPHAFDVMEAWGFKYQRVITWDKRNGMCLFRFHHRTEFCLFGYKGKLEMYCKGKAIPTLWDEKSPRHSTKPVGLQQAIEVFGENRIELFARRTDLADWDFWGDEV